MTCAVPAALSLISHKEVRFIYPLLPLLHIIAAEPLSRFFTPSMLYSLRSRRSRPHAIFKRLLLGLLILVNITIGLYTTTIHNRGVLDILAYLRHQHEKHYRQHDEDLYHHSSTNLTVAFLMPCHSTPWRSHLIHPEIEAWALTCEPPLHLSPATKETYLDEADVFYADPVLWLRQNMSRQPPSKTRSRGLISNPRGNSRFDPPHSRNHLQREQGYGGSARQAHRPWPDYLVFFQQAEKMMDLALRGSGYAECWRGFNTHWHDDWRRVGDVVVWCLWPEPRMIKDSKRASLNWRQPLASVQELKNWVVRKTSNVPDRPKHITGRPSAASADTSNSNSHSHSHSHSVLGGARGPWGIGKSKRPETNPPSTTSWWWWRGLPWRVWNERKGKSRRDVWA